MASGAVASALWNCSCEPKLSAIIENMALVLETIADVGHMHVNSHIGNPWNHFVDNSCALIRTHGASFAYDEIVSFHNFHNAVYD